MHLFPIKAAGTALQEVRVGYSLIDQSLLAGVIYIDLSNSLFKIDHFATQRISLSLCPNKVLHKALDN